VRADSGFFMNEFLEELGRRALSYVIAVRMNPLLCRAVAAIGQWQPFAPGWRRPQHLLHPRLERTASVGFGV
jgi:hypothetical protein